MAAYDKLMGKIKEITVLNSMGSILTWDREVYIPPKGYPQRGEQLALLNQLIHRMYTSPTFGKMLKETEKKANFEKLDPSQQRDVYLTRRDYDTATNVPEELVAAMAKQRTATIGAWRKAKAANDWKMVEPELVKMIDLSKKMAEIIQKVRSTPTLYDALIDDFEPNMTQATIDHVFTSMAKKLVPFAEKCIGPSKELDATVLRRKIPIDAQRRIATFLADFVQYDTTSPEAGGRIDETEHPFTSGYFDDVRITTHYYEDNIASSIYSVLHESGHAIYGQGLPQEFKWRQIGDASSYGIHESQSRFVENMVGRSSEFIRFFYPHLNKFTNNIFKDVAIDDFIRIVNRVQRSKIRIESDEVTYSLHIIIRFDIERDLFADKISVSDLPQVWIDKYNKYLKVSIDKDAEGAMQDVHHFSGYFGYFPSYALGNIYGGQLLQAMIKDIPDWLDLIGRGEFGKVKQWMVDHVHRKGNLYDPEDLVYHATGEKLNSQPFIDYLEAKYSKIFNL